MVLRISDIVSLSQPYEPSRTYHLLRGLTISFHAQIARLSGGADHSLNYDVDLAGSSNGIATQPVYQSIISKVEKLTTARLIAASNCKKSNVGINQEPEAAMDHAELPADRLLFFTKDRLISDADLGELLLRELQIVEKYCKNLLTSGGKNESSFQYAYNQVLFWQDENSAGRLNPAKLNQFISSVTPMVKEAFFFMNIIEVGESIRGSILGASYHLTRMTELIWRANMEISYFTGDPPYPQNEVKAMRQNIDRIADEYSSAVISAYSALDILYEYFVFLTRRNFAEPMFPRDHHFPAQRPSTAFIEGGAPRTDDIDNQQLPFAIPNLTDDDFRHLRVLRNDLAHNMAPDWHRPFAYVGIGLPPVGGLGIQYAQYLSRDVALNGQPITHPWTRRFYAQQLDGQSTLYELIEQVWQCCFDTTTWLSHRLKSVAHDNGFVEI